MRECSCGSGQYGAPVSDGYGVLLFYACGKCWREKISHYRRDIMQHYECDEPIEEE